MTKLEQLTKKLTETDAALDTLLANTDLTDDQRAEHDRLVAERDKTAEAIDREEARLAREADRKARDDKAAKLAARRPAGDGRLTDPDRPRQIIPSEIVNEGTPRRMGEGYTIPATVRRCRSLRSFKGARDGVPAEVRAFRFGMFAMAKLYNDLPGRYRHLRHAQEWVEKNLAANSSKDATGTQYLIPPEFGMDLIDLREQFGVARRLFKIVDMTTDTRTDPRRKGGLTANFTSEGSAGTESNKVWDNVQKVAKDLMVLSRYTNQVNDDAAINFGDDLAEEIAYAFSNKEDDCGFNGDGSLKYGGIIGILNKLTSVDGAGTDSAGLVTATTTGSWGAIILKDLQAVVALLPQYADTKDAAWCCHRAFYYNVMQVLELAAGGVTALEVQQGDRRPRPLFLGYPVEFAQIFPATTAAGQVSVTLGDYKKGVDFGDRQQDEIAFSEHATIGGENVFERNQIAIRGTERFDINAHDCGTSSVVGPIVGLTT